MPTKSTKSTPTVTTDNQTELFNSEDSIISSRNVSFRLVLNGNSPGTGDYHFYAIFNGTTILDAKWHSDLVLESDVLPVNLKDPLIQTLFANSPMILLLRSVGGKPTKEPDPLAHPDNRAGASVDLFPLILGEEEIFIRVPLVTITTGELTDCSVEFHAVSPGTKEDNLVPLLFTMVSVNCLPQARDNTVYISAIGLDGLQKPKALHFYSSLSTPNAQKIVFATVSTGGQIANTAMNVHTEDKFIPDDLIVERTEGCRSFYWNALRRILVDPEELYERLSSPFMIEVAGVPKTGKVDVRGRYMGLVDARVLLEPGQIGVTVCAKLMHYNEGQTPNDIGALLDLPPMSAKVTNRETDVIFDEYGHNAYVVIRLDLIEYLVPKTRLEDLYEIMGFAAPESFDPPIEKAKPDDPSVDVTPVIDARKVRKEGGALAVHKELSALACKGVIQMNQGIKRTAANRLLMRVRAMLKSFAPGECSYLDWEDTVTGQHAATRRAVTASFAPQPPPLRLPDKTAAARCRMAGDTRLAERHIKTNLKAAGSNPRSLMSKALRCLEERNDMDARNYLLEALSIQSMNTYLLWIYGGLEFDQKNENAFVAGAALQIAVVGDYSDGTANAIGWAALHAFYHCNDNMYAAFVAARKMRKAFTLPVEWDTFLERWIESSGEEEKYWMPSVLASSNPMLIAAAFFLCLRCYKFSERLLQCVEQNCAMRGSDSLICLMSSDVYYLRAASYILRRELDSAMDMILQGINTFGPSPIMSQIRATCMSCIRNWDRECEKALGEAEKFGSKICPSLLHSAALSGFKFSPKEALQKAARTHKATPCAHTALLIGRIYDLMGEKWLAERWLAAAVNHEPLLADAWAMLALLAIYERDMTKARIMLRTAKQAGPISPDIDEELRKVMDMVQLDQLPDFLVKNICFCEYYP